ncbi:MAG: hypothetical protein R3Y29_01050 [bacterium]
MATLSITRDFEVNTIEAYQKLEKIIEINTEEEAENINSTDILTIAEGEELLKSFSFR